MWSDCVDELEILSKVPSFLRKSTFKHKTTKSSHEMLNHVKKASKRQLLGLFINPFTSELPITACVDPCIPSTTCDLISFNGQGQLCQL